MAEYQKQENGRGHHRPPEEGGAEGIGRLNQAAALHLHAGARQAQGAPGVVGGGEPSAEGIKEQGADDQQPAGGEQPAHSMHASLAQLRSSHGSISALAGR